MSNRRQNTYGPKHILEPRRLAVHLDPPSDTSRLPPLGREADEDATAEWLAHVTAGRIVVR